MKRQIYIDAAILVLLVCTAVFSLAAKAQGGVYTYPFYDGSGAFHSIVDPEYGTRNYIIHGQRNYNPEWWQWEAGDYMQQYSTSPDGTSGFSYGAGGGLPRISVPSLRFR